MILNSSNQTKTNQHHCMYAIRQHKSHELAINNYNLSMSTSI